MTSQLPNALQQVVNLFSGSPKSLRLQALMEFSKKIPPLPARYADHPEHMEQVHECQSPFFLAVELEEGRVHLYFDAPVEAPTVRGFAGILIQALDNASIEDVLCVPQDFYVDMGLSELITPMRLRGMSAILGRIQHQVRSAQSS